MNYPRTIFWSIAFLLASIATTTSCKVENQSVSETNTPKISKTAYTDISVTEARQLHEQNSDIVFLDVRTPEEVSEGQISGAIVIDYRADGFEEKVAKLDRDEHYIVYCRSGGRSSQASELMEKLGYTKVQNLVGGYTAWSESK